MIKKILLSLLSLSLTGFILFTGISAFASSTNGSSFNGESLNEESLSVGCVSDFEYEHEYKQALDEFLQADDEIFHYPIDSREIQEIVKSFETENTKDVLEFAGEIKNYVKYALRPSSEETGASVLESLTLGKGDCDDYARLFVTLARAVGIPARVQFNSNHMWAEVLVPTGDGNNNVNYCWVVVDPTDSFSL